MDCIARNLKPGGRAAIQFISMSDDLFDAYAEKRGLHPGLHFPRRPADPHQRVPRAGRSARAGVDRPGRFRPRLCRDAADLARELRCRRGRERAARRVRRALRAALALLPDVLRRRVPRRRDRCPPGDAGQGGNDARRYSYLAAVAGAGGLRHGVRREQRGPPHPARRTLRRSRNSRCCSGTMRPAPTASGGWRTSSPATKWPPRRCVRKLAAGHPATTRRLRRRSTRISPVRTRRGSWCCRTAVCATRSTRSASGRPALDELLGRQELHLDPARGGGEGRLHQPASTIR